MTTNAILATSPLSRSAPPGVPVRPATGPCDVYTPGDPRAEESSGSRALSWAGVGLLAATALVGVAALSGCSPGSSGDSSVIVNSNGGVGIDTGSGVILNSDGRVGIDTGSGVILNSDGSIGIDTGSGIIINSDGGVGFKF